jgi:hypothetical protein
VSPLPPSALVVSAKAEALGLSKFSSVRDPQSVAELSSFPRAAVEVLPAGTSAAEEARFALVEAAAEATH